MGKVLGTLPHQDVAVRIYATRTSEEKKSKKPKDRKKNQRTKKKKKTNRKKNLLKKMQSPPFLFFSNNFLADVDAAVLVECRKVQKCIDTHVFFSLAKGKCYLTIMDSPKYTLYDYKIQRQFMDETSQKFDYAIYDMGTTQLHDAKDGCSLLPLRDYFYFDPTTNVDTIIVFMRKKGDETQIFTDGSRVVVKGFASNKGKLFADDVRERLSTILDPYSFSMFSNAHIPSLSDGNLINESGELLSENPQVKFVPPPKRVALIYMRHKPIFKPSGNTFDATYYGTREKGLHYDFEPVQKTPFQLDLQKTFVRRVNEIQSFTKKFRFGSVGLAILSTMSMGYFAKMSNRNQRKVVDFVKDSISEIARHRKGDEEEEDDEGDEEEEEEEEKATPLPPVVLPKKQQGGSKPKTAKGFASSGFSFNP